jgi:hypothetical protein
MRIRRSPFNQLMVRSTTQRTLEALPKPPETAEKQAETGVLAYIPLVA